ncbi:hypothetical protein FRAHR75_330088 [Frankia sp. Hr75.2]|nr:hypothetical protein FRAHR75_330088 [Frankia sp. Hr75.2]
MTSTRCAGKPGSGWTCADRRRSDGGVTVVGNIWLRLTVPPKSYRSATGMAFRSHGPIFEMIRFPDHPILDHDGGTGDQA